MHVAKGLIIDVRLRARGIPHTLFWLKATNRYKSYPIFPNAPVVQF